MYTVPGTPQFLAPELLRGDAPSVRTDIYAMGVLLYEMFTGQVPFDDPDTARLVRKVISEAPPKAETLRPDLPPELLGILDRAIAKDPAARFLDADSLADAVLPRNERATAILRNSSLAQRPDLDPARLPFVAGTAVLFDEPVWFE